MIISAAYRDNTFNSCGVCDESGSIIVNGCGSQLLQKSNLTCYRDSGMADYLMIYVYKGLGNFKIDGAMHPVSEGNIILYRPFEPQAMEYYYKDHPQMFWIHITGSDSKNLLQETELYGDTVIPIGIHEELARQYQAIINLLNSNSKRSKFHAKIAVLQLLSSVSEYRDKLQEGDLYVNYIDKIIEFLHLHYHEDYTNKQLATRCNLSEFHFIHLFKKATGVPPKAYINQVRMGKAEELLCMSRLNMNEIATLVGFKNPLYFSRAFKKYSGISPTEYRQR